jgi:hypothetical protein
MKNPVKKTRRANAARKPVKRKSAKAGAKKDIAASYNAFKEFEGKRYTGMKIGRGHTWIYDSGEWKETKMTPDKWEINFTVTKRRKGKAPEGSGVPVGTEYHWYILAHQIVRKLNANDYSTSLTGLKYKLAHRRADQDKWNISDKTQRKHLAKLLQEFIDDLEGESELQRVEETPAVVRIAADSTRRKTKSPKKRTLPRGRQPVQLTRAKSNGHAGKKEFALNENEE